jgi:hypothetical protein
LLSQNPNITWEIVRDNPDKNWNWISLSRNPNITWEIVQNNPDKPWNWVYLSKNPNITWEIIKDNPDKPWKKVEFVYNTLLYDPVVNKKQKTLHTKYRHTFAKNIFEGISAFSRNIDRVIRKRLSYN